MKNSPAVRRYWRNRTTGVCVIGRGRTFNPENWEEITYEEYLNFKLRNE